MTDEQIERYSRHIILKEVGAKGQKKLLKGKVLIIGAGGLGLKAIQGVFGDHAYKLNLSSTKSMTGHLLGATGALEAMFCVKSVQEDIVPPTINHEDGDNDPEIDYNLNFTFGKAQKRTVNAALSNTFGFGGHNACIIMKKYKG